MKCFRKKAQPAEELFRPELSIDLDSKDILKKAEFIHDNSKEYLLNTIDTSSNLEKKALLILSFIFAFISFGIFQIVTLIEKHSLLWINFFIPLILVYLCIAILLAFKCFYPNDSAISGNEPRNLLDQNNIEQQYELMLIAETITYQERINDNKKLNEKMAYWVKTAIIILTLSTIVDLLLFMLTFLNVF
jgi:hypothetical protein